MANQVVKHARGTAAAFATLASGSGLVAGQLYALTDTEQVAFALTTSTYFLIGGGGGSSEWTRLELSSDQEFTTTSFADVPDLDFTPAANKKYIIRGNLYYIPSNSSSAYCYFALDWYTDAAASASMRFQWSDSAGEYDVPGQVREHGDETQIQFDDNFAQNDPNIADVHGFLIVGGSPSGNLSFQGKCISTSASYHWKFLAGSYIEYREI